MLSPVFYCKDNLFLCQFLQRGHTAKDNFILQIIRIIQRCWSAAQRTVWSTIFLLWLAGVLLPIPFAKTICFYKYELVQCNQKQKHQPISQEHICGIIVPSSRRNMVAGSRMELRFGRTDQSPVRKETMAEWRLPRWSHCKLWWKLNVGTISKRKMGNLNLFDISHDFYRLPALYYFEKYHIWKHYVLENKFWFHPS